MVMGSYRTEAHGLAALVMQALQSITSFAEDLVSVRERGGAVHLCGRVGSYQAKRQMEHAAARVPGVRYVVNELRIAMPMFRSDQQLAAAVNAALAGEPLLSDFRPVVAARGGTVFLQGVAGNLRQRAAAEECAWSVRGVRDVHNRVTVQEDPGEQKDSLLLDISRQLAASLGLGARNVEVDLRQGIAHLRGIVPTEEHRRRAADAVGWNRRILGIVDEMSVPGPTARNDLAAGVNALPLEQSSPQYGSLLGSFASDPS